MTFGFNTSVAEAAPIQSGLQLWLDGNDASTITTSGGAVDKWADKSAAGNDATASGNDRPSHIAAAGPNGTGEVAFDGNDDLLNAGTVIPSDSSTTIFFVFDYPVADDRGGVFQRNDGTNNFTGVSLGQGGSNLWVFEGRDDGGDLVRAKSSPKAGLQMWQGSLDFNATGTTTVRLFEDGTQADANTANDIDSLGTGSDDLLLMRRGTGPASQSVEGDVSEVIIYDRAINSAERVVTQNYLSSKFDLALAGDDFYAGDTAANSDFDHDVFGAGNGSGVGSDTAGTINAAASTGDGITLEATAGLDAGDFLLAGFENDNDFTQSTFFLDVTDLNGDAELEITFDTGVLGLTGTEWLAFNASDPDALSALTPGTLTGNDLTFSISGNDLQDGFFGVAIPEPASVALIGLGGVILLTRRERARG